MSQSKMSASVRYNDEFESKSYEDDLFNDPELVSLLEQILTEVFQVEESEESVESLSGNSIYFLGNEREIKQIEKRERAILNEGSSEVDSLDELLKEAESYFKQPSNYSCEESDDEKEFVTGFIQMHCGVSFNSNGQLITKWKSIDCKIEIELQDLFQPDLIIQKIEGLGIKWTELVRVTFYGPCLEKIVGYRFYEEDDSKELIPLSDDYQNILLAIPQIVSDLKHSDSIFDFVEHEINEGIPFGITPDLGRVAFGHWEWTHVRLNELEEDEMEARNLKSIEREEKLRVKEINDFNSKYKEAKDIIKGLNEKKIDPVEVYSLSLATLESILFVCEKLNFRLNESTHYYQVKAIFTKNKVVTLSTQATQALSIISKINKGEHVDFHLISLQVLEDVFAILWGGLGIKIDASKKAHYFTLKDSLLRLRALEARKSQK